MAVRRDNRLCVHIAYVPYIKYSQHVCEWKVSMSNFLRPARKVIKTPTFWHSSKHSREYYADFFALVLHSHSPQFEHQLTARKQSLYLFQFHHQYKNNQNEGCLTVDQDVSCSGISGENCFWQIAVSLRFSKFLRILLNYSVKIFSQGRQFLNIKQTVPYMYILTP